ncbi:MAG TPA: hybrid sensor histidine kinase/response regulator [Bacteroidales bacterium]|nr:hybrid sensor histidine kinase/response regulator [Bacteroidales bacterium]
MIKNPSNWVLIVDDNENNLVYLQNILQRADISCKTTTQGKECLNLCMNDPPSLILLDVMMPEMNGYEVCKRLKESEITRDIPVIFISALISKEDILKGFEMGGVDYITKPFHKEEVLARVKAHLTIVTQQKKLELTNRELKEALAVRDRLFSIISHDLIGPILNIENALKLLMEERLSDEERFDFLQESLNAASSTLDLLKNLLSWAKNQIEGIDYNPHNVDVSIIIGDILNLFQRMQKEKKIDIINHIQESLICFADENMLHLIFRNLISNALKYSYEGGKIEILHHNERDSMVFEIMDKGKGIATEEVEKILDPIQFYSTPGTAYEKGHGLGLRLCKEFIEIHGGELKIISEPGKGSIFRFSIPQNLTNLKH